MSDPIRFGVLSFAHYHGNFWAEAINDSPEATLAGVWDDDVDRGQEAAAKYDTRFYSDLDDLLQECDAVGITSETVKHAPLVERAAAAGVHILLEKPMAATREDCDRIARAVQESGVKFMQNFPKRFDPVNHKLVELVRDGTLGKLCLVRIRHANYHFLEVGDEEWFTDPSLSGGGSFLDEGIHAADFLFWLLGKPKQVFAAVSDSALELPVDDTGVALFTYPSGVLAELATGGSLVAAEESVEIYGTGGSAILSGVDLASRDFSKKPYLKVFRRGNERGVWEGSDLEPFFKQGNFHQQGPLHFIEYLHGRAEPIVRLEDGRISLEMILAGYRAAETGQAQTIAG